MKEFLEYYDRAVELYGVVGLVLGVLIITLFIAQICCYAIRYRRIINHKNSLRAPLRDTPPAISVIIPMFGEDSRFIEEHLPRFIAQQGVTFEIVVVYVGSNREFYEDFQAVSQQLPMLTITKIELNERFPISVKTALNVGLKAAKYDYVLLSTTEVYPNSDRWLSLMSKGFTRADVILGYSGVERAKGFGNYFARTYRMVESISWLSSAICLRPYRGIRSNLGFKKQLYFDVRGFNHLTMKVGVEDLFMQQIMSRTNTGVVISPKVTLTERAWGGFSWWRYQYRENSPSFKFYPSWAKRRVRYERITRVLLLVLAIVAAVIMPWEFGAVAVGLWLIRTLVAMLIINKIAKRLGESGIAGRYIIFDILSPILTFFMTFGKLRKQKPAWK